MGYLSTARDKFIKFFNLSFEYKLKTLVYSVLFHLFLPAFRLFGFRKSKNFIDRLNLSRNNAEHSSGINVKNESKVVNYTTGNSFFRSTCLEKSLFLYFILGLHGIKCNLKIGVNDSNVDFNAHAWLEYRDVLLNDRPESIENYSPFNT